VSGPEGQPAGVDVSPDGWLAAVERAKADGFDYFDWLGCVDELGRSDTFRVVLVLRDLRRTGAELLIVQTQVPRDEPRLASLGLVFPGAAWHEREAAELFGIEFDGGDPRRLLLDPDLGGHPLRKDEVLAARAGTPWPGTKEPGESGGSRDRGDSGSAPGRRRMAPAGVPDPQVWGDRDSAAGPADPAEVAESTLGARPRRRRP
jgi:NADH-quinone oxidoreductase subunit C